MDVNVKGTLLCCQVVGAAMAREGRARSSTSRRLRAALAAAGRLRVPSPRGESFTKPVAYSVSKSAILNLTRYLATYWAKDGVRVNTLTLAGVFERPAGTSSSKAYTARVPLGRMAEAREALGAVVFLASDASSYMTGANLVVDGGWSAW